MKRRFIQLLTLTCFIGFTACQEDIANIPAPNPVTDAGGEEEEEDGIDPQYQPCLNELDDQTLDIMTWNLEFFPKSGNVSEENVYDIIKNSQVDIVGVQEIDSWSSLEELADKLGGWEAELEDVLGNQDIGYLYKPSEIEILESPFKIYRNNGSPFPREPIVTKIRHKQTGLEVVLINIHLKCCGGNSNESRRQEASRLLKQYIDAEYPNTAVVVLGDWNDDIYETNGVNVFQNFMDDTENYRFADKDVAQGPSSGWSYPSFPSHIDHILMTDELFDHFKDSRTLTVNQCLNTYYSTVSDHRPVIARFE